MYEVERVLDLQSFRCELENTLKPELNFLVVTRDHIKTLKVRLKVTIPPSDSEVGLLASIIMITLQITLICMGKNNLCEVIINCTT